MMTAYRQASSQPVLRQALLHLVAVNLMLLSNSHSNMQIIQAVSLVVLFASLGFRLSERSEGSGSGGNTDSFRQQLTHILTSPQATHEV